MGTLSPLIAPSLEGTFQARACTKSSLSLGPCGTVSLETNSPAPGSSETREKLVPLQMKLEKGSMVAEVKGYLGWKE